MAQDREVVQPREGLRLPPPGRRRADVFVHYSEIDAGGVRSLEEGQRVEVEIGQGQKGPQAQGVRII
jgi:cold shock CspA family protein